MTDNMEQAYLFNYSLACRIYSAPSRAVQFIVIYYDSSFRFIIHTITLSFEFYTKEYIAFCSAIQKYIV